MQQPTPRPVTVPAEASWNGSQKEWELGEKNDKGQYIGEWKWWLAPTGHLCCHTFFDDQGQLLSFKRFHPNGEVSRYGTYENGQPIEDVYLKSTEPTTEVFAYGNNNKNVYKAVKRAGVPVSFDYYDRDGQHLNPRLEKQPLITDEDMLVPSEELAQIEASIYAKGKGFLRDQFDKDFYLETILPLVKEPHKGMVDNISGEAIVGKRDFVFHAGDLHLSNLYCLEQLEIGALIIEGNLTVDGSIDLNDDLMEILVVTGNVTANNVTISGALLVYGDLTVSNCLLGDYNHGSTIVEGDLTAKFFHPEEYFFEVNGAVNFTYAFGNSWRLNENQNSAAFNWNARPLGDFVPLLHDNLQKAARFENNPIFLADACEKESLFEYLDRYEFISYVMAGKPVFKS